MNILVDSGKYRFYNDLTIEKTLLPETYIFEYDINGNMWLEKLEDFKVPEKVYDVNKTMRSMIKTSFEKYSTNLGVLLTGNKGQGKSLEAKMICRDMNLPVIVINKRIPEDVNFVSFFNGIKQDFTLFVDEFEKLFNATKPSKDEAYHTQVSFLSFMDGVMTNDHKILFLLTTNEEVNEYFINRPSRIKFLKEYFELEETLFNMIVEDRLLNMEYKSDLEDNISLMNLNIDTLISIINDINLFDKPFSEFKDYFNYRFENYRYEVCIDNAFKGFWSDQRRPRVNDVWIADRDVNEIISFSKDEIIFTSNEWVPNEKGKNVKKEVTVKLTLTKGRISSTIVS